MSPLTSCVLALALLTRPVPQDDPEKHYEQNSRRAAARDAFPVLDHPKMVNAAEAADMRDEDRVIGVDVGGEARAYPIAVMGRHELANDTCGKTPIAVSW